MPDPGPQLEVLAKAAQHWQLPFGQTHPCRIRVVLLQLVTGPRKFCTFRRRAGAPRLPTGVFVSGMAVRLRLQHFQSKTESPAPCPCATGQRSSAPEGSGAAAGRTMAAVVLIMGFGCEEQSKNLRAAESQGGRREGEFSAVCPLGGLGRVAGASRSWDGLDVLVGWWHRAGNGSLSGLRSVCSPAAAPSPRAVPSRHSLARAAVAWCDDSRAWT